MTQHVPSAELRARILLLLPTGRDADMTRAILEDNGLLGHVCRDASELHDELSIGAGAVLIGEELLQTEGVHTTLARTLEAQEPWSDLPVMILTGRGADSLAVGDAVALLGNVTLLERPMRVTALLSALRASLRARARQYDTRDHLRALESARDAEADAVRHKDEFLAMLAHELRNPLAPIRNALHVLSMDDSDPGRRSELRAMMGRQVDHMVRLVDDLMEASRVSRGNIELCRRAIDLRDVLRSAAELSAPLIAAGCYTLRMDMSDAPLTVRADHVRLTQVFSNLLNNAAKYGRSGGRIWVRAYAVEGAVEIEVADDGTGIEPDVLPYVFELFTQGRHRLQGGLGIGLALVKQLVEQHDGHVEVHSEGRDRGTRVLVRLPTLAAVPDETATPDLVSVARPLDREALRVLVVDDNKDAALTLSLMLELLGMDYRIASDGQAALAEAARFSPHVGLLDIGLPDMDGYELALRIHANPRLAEVVLIAITGWAGARDQQKARAAGFVDHFRKPADITRLSMLLEATRANLLRRNPAESSVA